MTINTDFPFKHCESCEECVIDVEEQIIFANDGFLTRKLMVRCKNDALCKRLEEQRNARNED